MHLHSIPYTLQEETFALYSLLAQLCSFPLPVGAFWTFAMGQVFISSLLGYCRTPNWSSIPRLFSCITSPKYHSAYILPSSRIFNGSQLRTNQSPDVLVWCLRLSIQDPAPAVVLLHRSWHEFTYNLFSSGPFLVRGRMVH